MKKLGYEGNVVERYMNDEIAQTDSNLDASFRLLVTIERVNSNVPIQLIVTSKTVVCGGEVVEEYQRNDDKASDHLEHSTNTVSEEHPINSDPDISTSAQATIVVKDSLAEELKKQYETRVKEFSERPECFCYIIPAPFGTSCMKYPTRVRSYLKHIVSPFDFLLDPVPDYVGPEIGK